MGRNDARTSADTATVASDLELHSLNVAISLLAKAKKAATEQEFLELIQTGYRAAHKVWHDRYLGVGGVK